MGNLVKRFVLENALEHGEASVGSVLGRVLHQYPELKEDIGNIRDQITALCITVNALNTHEREELLGQLGGYIEKVKREALTGLKPLAHAIDGKVVMRVAPSPSGPLHIGHAYVFGLSFAYCQHYHGTFILRIDDTHPANCYEPAYAMIEADARWLGNIDMVVRQSDHMKEYYAYAEKLLSYEQAYVCTCHTDLFRQLLHMSEPCPCRSLSAQEHIRRWDMMFSSFKSGDAVVRIKTDLTLPNPALRDWPAFRISEEEHPLTKHQYRVWPLMNFAVAIDDHLLGITHTIRGKDHMDNEKRQHYIFDYFGWKMPEHVYVGRVNFLGLNLSTTETRKKIEYGEFSGWDDVRLPFLPALRRRGYQAKAFRQFALSIGITEADKTVPQDEFFKVLNHYNKDIIDREAYRYFFLADPLKLVILGAPSLTVSLDLHPDIHKGGRTFMTGTEFLVSHHVSFEQGKLYRMIDCVNFMVTEKGYEFHSTDYLEYKRATRKGGMVSFIPLDAPRVECDILLETGERVQGVAEHGVDDVPNGNIVQFVQVGFCRKESSTLFVFLHR